MAWSICITPEGWDAIRTTLEGMERDELLYAICEDEFERVEQNGGAPDEADFAAQQLHGKLDSPNVSHDALVETAFSLIQEHNTCDNGGNGYYIDREGYHRVYTPPNPERSVPCSSP